MNKKNDNIIEDYITAYEYESNVNPLLGNIPIFQKNINDCNYGITFINFSDVYKADYKCTSPNLLASFIKLKGNETIVFPDFSRFSWINNVSNLMYVINGKCDVIYSNNKINDAPCSFVLEKGDIFICPSFTSFTIKNICEDELNIYYINDSPLINFLGCSPTHTIFSPSVYKKDFLEKNILNLSNEKNNRKGILLSNKDTEKFGINTITPVLWALYNELPPKTIQRHHRHNSVALDLCIRCDDPTKIYTLIGEKLDENGDIVNPQKIYWKTSEMFITPPGLWHSHHNEGDTTAYILPIQDAGLLLYQRILGIQITR